MHYLRFAYAAGLLLLWVYAASLWVESRRLSRTIAQQNRLAETMGEKP